MNENDLGFGPFFEEQLSPGDARACVARVAAAHRGACEIWGLGDIVGRARLSGRLRHDDGDVAVGDWVVLDRPAGPDHTATIERVLARRTEIARGAAGRETRKQVIAANVDVVLVVCGLDADFNVRRIERYLAVLGAAGSRAARAEIIFTKADLTDAAAARAAEVERRCPGVAVFVTSALEARGIADVRRAIGAGETAVLVGSSGAGKSTLVNALAGEERMPTGHVRASDGRGRHTTTRRQLLVLAGGGLLIDTPGMREVGLVDEEALGEAFGDLAELARGCRFRDCRHEGEPGCALLRAVEEGTLDDGRLAHHHALEREARAFELRHDAQKRRQAGRVFGRMVREATKERRRREGG